MRGPFDNLPWAKRVHAELAIIYIKHGFDPHFAEKMATEFCEEFKVNENQ